MFDRRCSACLAAALLSGIVAAGCAMERQAPKAPEAPAPQQATPPSAPGEEQEAPAATQPESATPAPATPGYGGGTTTGGPSADKAMSFDDLLDQLTVAEGMALSAGRDCTGACRALKSMERAAGGICSLAPRTDSTGRCRSAEDRVRSAREKVRSACGQCADGTTVDPDAPVE